METTSIHLDRFGTVLKNINDGDNHVYEHDDAKTTADVDKNYSAKNTSAGGKDIGELGKKIDVSKMATNLLARDGKIAEGLNTTSWINKVLPGHDWDLKAGNKTIFGVAWKFDQDIKEATGGDNDTFFSFKGMGENGKFTAADFGNYHAGYTGVAAGVSQRTQYTFAGFGEMAKLRGFSDVLHRANEILFNISPNGDQRPDFHYNTDGMIDASKAGLHP